MKYIFRSYADPFYFPNHRKQAGILSHNCHYDWHSRVRLQLLAEPQYDIMMEGKNPKGPIY